MRVSGLGGLGFQGSVLIFMAERFMSTLLRLRVHFVLMCLASGCLDFCNLSSEVIKGLVRVFTVRGV